MNIQLTFMLILLAITYTDIKAYKIPDFLIGMAFVLGTIRCIMEPSLLIDNILGLFIGFIILLVIGLLFYGSIGGGDIKLISIIGFWVGVNKVVNVIALSFVVTAIASILLITMKKKTLKDPIALAPSIVAITYIIMLA